MQSANSVRPDSQLLLPPPCAFLTRTQQLRMRGDSGPALTSTPASPSAPWRCSCGDPPVDTPRVHVLFEGMNPGDHETNPGMDPGHVDVVAEGHQPVPAPSPQRRPRPCSMKCSSTFRRPLPSRSGARRAASRSRRQHPPVRRRERPHVSFAAPALCVARSSRSGSIGHPRPVVGVAQHLHRDAPGGNRIREYDERKDYRRAVRGVLHRRLDPGAECARTVGELLLLRRPPRPWMSATRATIAGVIEVQRCCTWDELTATRMDFERIDAAVAELLDRRVAAWTPRPAGCITVDDTARFALALTV